VNGNALPVRNFLCPSWTLFRHSRGLFLRLRLSISRLIRRLPNPHLRHFFLSQNNISTVVITGSETGVCDSQLYLIAIDLDFWVVIVKGPM
jgi:hypothetical protein